MSKFDDIDDPNYQETNCGLGMAGYMTPDEKEIERLNKRVEELEAELTKLPAGADGRGRSRKNGRLRK